MKSRGSITKTKFKLNLTGLIPLAIAGGCNEIVTEKPNIVFFLVDDLGWVDVGCYGSNFYETPNIDGLAESGVRFTNAYAACHVSSPTRASILTGKYPATLNLTDWLPGRRNYSFQKFNNAEINQYLPYEEVTLAEALKKYGYTTAIYGKWHLGEDPSNPFAHGFDVQIPRWAKGWPKTGYYAPFELDGIPDKEGDYLTDRLTDEALSFIDDNKNNPFFLYLSHFTVHDPIQGRNDLVKKYTEKLRNMPASEIPPYILEGNPDDPDPISREEALELLKLSDYSGYSGLPQKMVKIKQLQDNVHFAAMVESMDESLGRVLAKLNELNLDKKTIVVFFSDNGGMAAANFGNPARVISENQLDKAFSTSNLPLRGAKGWLYEGGIRVPLIIKWPGYGNSGNVCDVPVISVDFYPTIMEMLGLNVPVAQKVDGVSIVSLLKGSSALNRDAIFWHFPHYSNHGMQSPGGAIRSGDYKLIEYFENNTVQLFNLRNDVSEQNDISESEQGIVNELRSKLHEWRKDVKAQMMVPNPDFNM